MKTDCDNEIVETPFAAFHFSYLKDSRFLNLNPQIKTAINDLDLPTITLSQTEKAVKELEIRNKLFVHSLIPSDREKKFIIPSLGTGARTSSATKILLFFDPLHPRVVENLKFWRAREILHEVNHATRMQENKMERTLLGSIIGEGLATYYQEQMDNIYQPSPWGHALNQDNLLKEWGLLQPELNSITYSHREWFFGKDKKHPTWTGYSLGTAIIESFMSKYPEMKMSKLVRMSTEEILKLSKFSP